MKVVPVQENELDPLVARDTNAMNPRATAPSTVPTTSAAATPVPNLPATVPPSAILAEATAGVTLAGDSATPSGPRPAARGPARADGGLRGAGSVDAVADRTPGSDGPALTGVLPALSALSTQGSFVARHIGPRAGDTAAMLEAVGHSSLASLADACVPEGVRDRTPLALPAAADEATVLAELRERATANEVFTSMIGLGYSGTITPTVIQRTVLENPAWYTAYTPYQPEISQGRLEALINFQTMVADLTGLPVAGASMLDEATAAAEAMTLVRRAGRATAGAVFVVDAATLPQTLAVLQTRAEPLGIPLHVTDLSAGWPTDLPAAGAFGVLLSYPGASGAVRDHRALAAAAHEAGASVVVAADLLALTLLEAPGEWGADVV